MAQLDKIRLSGITYDLVDSTAVHSLEGYATTNDVTAATAALAESIEEQHYQTSGDVQSAISGKADTTAVTESINAAVSGKVDTTAYTAYTAATETILGNKADKSEIPAVSGYADAVAYDSNAKEMKFYHGGTGGTEVFSFDASPFIIDGMVDNVEIKTLSGASYLVITFNTDAGKEEIDVPLTDIFDASNYYTTAQTDSIVSGLTARMAEDEEVTAAALNDLNEEVSGKADTSAVTESINAAVSGKVDTSTYTAYTAATATALSNKQDTLVSGTNIKTVGGNSLLGSGNVDWPAGMTASVSGTTLIFG